MTTLSNEKKHVLVIEDEEATRRVFVEELTQEGFTVSSAENGGEGLKLALARHPDLILLDIILPVMDGLTVLKRLREDVWGKDAKVIVMTQMGQHSAIKASAEAMHPVAYFSKEGPSLDEIMRKAKEVLASS